MTPEEKARFLDELHAKLIDMIGMLQGLTDLHAGVSCAIGLAALPLSQQRIVNAYDELTLAYAAFLGDVNQLRAPLPPALRPLRDAVRGCAPPPDPGLH